MPGSARRNLSIIGGRINAAAISVAVMQTVLSRLGLAGGGERDKAGRRAHGADVIQQLLPARRQRQTAPDALEKHHAELRLQRGDLTPERRLRHAERTRRRGQRPLLRRDQKRAGAIPVELDAAPIHTLMHMS